MTRPLFFAFLFLLLGWSLKGMAAAEEIDFARDIRPIFNLHCVGCHGGVKNAGDFKITEKDETLQRIVPFQPDESSLWERVTSTDPDLRMPPVEHGAPLSASESELLKKWILEGASWTNHWAFEPPKSHPAPEIKTRGWPRSKVDAFILHEIEKRGLAPAPSADSLRWLRRVSLTLIGLPPTSEQCRKFQAQEAIDPEQARATVVDELLASQHFGEHWGAMWLDQIRYADSRGLGQDGRRTMWKYRDWVIDAFNSDLPYDRFTTMQIAGDLLPGFDLENQIATAAHRMTHTNEEGGTDDEEFRIAAVVDRINTTWQVWQGMTFGCVQCHDHPYDPFRHSQYYESMAYFNNTADCDLNEEFPLIQVPLSHSDYLASGKLQEEFRGLREKVWKTEFQICEGSPDWKRPRGMKVEATKGTEVSISEGETSSNEFHTTNTVARDTDYIVEWESDEEDLSAVRVTLRPIDPVVAERDSEWGAVLSYVRWERKLPGQSEFESIPLSLAIADESDPFFAAEESLNEKSTTGFGAYSRIRGDRKCVYVSQKAFHVPQGTILRLTLQHRIFTLDAFPLVARRVAIEYSNSRTLSDQLFTEERVNDRNRLKELKKSISDIPSTTVPVLRELSEPFRRPTHVFQRGLFLTKGEQVGAGLANWLVPDEQSNPKNRLEFAAFLTSKQNPLTARVAVNRIWARVFGAGLVLTEEDFGSSGEMPTHPELLDDLAVRFQGEMQWSQKKLLRELLLSATFAQSSVFRSDLAEIDPQNRWLARGPRLRLPAEVVRDQALFVSGLLEPELFGPPVYPPIPEGVWVPFQGGDTWKTPEAGKPGRYRRSIYTYTKRSIPYPMLAAFDAPSREFCTARRLNSNTPIQALTTLNELTFIECAEALCKKMAKEGNSPRERIRKGFLEVLCREPTTIECEEIESYWRSASSASDEEKGWRSVALLLLNLDENFTN